MTTETSPHEWVAVGNVAAALVSGLSERRRRLREGEESSRTKERASAALEAADAGK